MQQLNVVIIELEELLIEFELMQSISNQKQSAMFRREKEG